MPRRQDGPKFTSRATHHSRDVYVPEARTESGGAAPVGSGAITALIRLLARQAAREWRAESVTPQSAPPSNIPATTQPTDDGDRDGER